MIDANLHYAMRTDPLCEVDCDYERVQDFHALRRLTGVDVGFFNASMQLERLVENSAYIRGNSTSFVVETSFDLVKARKEGIYGVLFYCQKHYPLHGSVAPLEKWYNHGLRTLQLAYNSSDLPNQAPEEMLAGGSDQPEQGVTELGKAVIRELNRLHMVVDVSHCSPRSVFDAVQLSTDPITANHSNAYTLTPHRRNKTDEELRAIAATGGVIGVTPVAWMLDTDGDGLADIDDFVRHVNYMVDLVGIDHVGVATDARVDGWEKSSRHYCDEHMAAPDRWMRVAQKLKAVRDAGERPKYTEAALAKVFGGNFLRMFQRVLVGLAPPELNAPVYLDNSAGIEFSWKPARAIGVPTARYNLRLASMVSGRLELYTEVKELSGDHHILATSNLPTNGEFWWQVAAHNEAGQVASPWQVINVPGETRAFSL